MHLNKDKANDRDLKIPVKSGLRTVNDDIRSPFQVSDIATLQFHPEGINKLIFIAGVQINFRFPPAFLLFYISQQSAVFSHWD